jgi:pimeloyl-ACP methyl ester carboxylesterase
MFEYRYFDAEIQPDEYSYVNAALKKGYSILTYDRLGTGKSQKPNAYDVVQIPTEIEILASLTKIARSGKLISSSKVLSSSRTTVSDFEPSKVVQIGYSFGSFLIQNVLARYPELSDGAVLTALYPNTIPFAQMIDVLHYDHEFPKENDPARFSEYGSGYFVLSNKADLQKLFFQKRSLDPALLTYTEKIKQPETLGEYASEGLSSYLVAENFKGPVQVSVQ